ncbi:PVC-type heme-binding CxxCH protein [Luteolibacter soli]|uniref:PVC-type heme-binding CxxCH protein n=1 Tax=Luteolibacter soli TaxID=3135280 RepID=A0ABU9AXZ0_9BACT
MMRLVPLLFLILSASGEPVSLFDGKTLDGWEVRAGEEKWWKVQDGCITGGSLEEPVAHNTFLATTKRYANFELKLKMRLVKGEGFMNSGVQIRSIRVPGNFEMEGYQVDAGPGWWGKLYDESRRDKVIGEPVKPAELKANDFDWNEYRIVCEGPRIQSWVNGVAALDYTEADAKIPLEGLIGLQTHGGGKVLVQFKEITIEELPATPGAPTWEKADPRLPENEKASFTVPGGFEVELVASEKEGVGKPITMAWDHAGRMWTMTALEYPVDANEDEAQAEALYQKGGKDKVLVFDEPWKPGLQTPRVFADGLAIPLGMMPWKGGAVVQYGHDVRYYADRNNDGKADGHEVLLTGFGIQDSHLFPHQFERSPGGWLYLAQGLFNYSKVKRPGDVPFADGSKEVAFNQCKLARAKLDGSAFELLTAGPNNIWGFVTGRDGREFLQEANDLGHPVSEFIAGTHYPTGSKEKLRPYAPQLPESTPGQPMGGTGLSGLALADDEGSSFAAKWPEEKMFYIANPITNRIQIVTRAEDGKYQKREDFLVSSDEWFRPVSVQFGPDGCLYIADWYNKIISHNEVPRNHPDRDKTRGRIWRVKAKGVAPVQPPDLTKLKATRLIEQLDNGNARVARMAWEELGDRNDKSVVEDLEELARKEGAPVATRLGALFALREMNAVTLPVVLFLMADKNADLRREALEASEQLASKEQEPMGTRRSESDFSVLATHAIMLRRYPTVTSKMLQSLAWNVPPASEGNDCAAYERKFLRYLIRWAMEAHVDVTREILGADLLFEGKALAVLSLPPEEAARRLLQLLPLYGRPLNAEESALLGSQLSQPEVAKAFAELADDPNRRGMLLKSLLQIDPSAAADPLLRASVGKATEAMVRDNPTTMPLAFDLARRFQLKELAPLLREQASKGVSPEVLASILKTLNEIQSADAGLAKTHLDDGNEMVAREALIGFASAGGAEAVAEIGKRWGSLSGALRQFAVSGMVSNKESTEAFAKAVTAGGFTGFDPSVVEKLSAVLGADHPVFKELLSKVEGLLVPTIRLPGKNGAVVATGLKLEGPFTVESWIKLDEGIDNRDGLLGKRGGGPCVNFWDAKVRFWDGARDVVIAERPVKAGKWSHCAMTRDDAGKIAVFVDGEPAGVSQGGFDGAMEMMDIGKVNEPGGTAASLLEFRVWDIARSPAEILGSFRTRFTSGQDHLVFHAGADLSKLTLEGGAGIEWTVDFPELHTPEQAAALAAKFDRFRAMASKGGDAAAGKQLFQATCMICHQAKGEGTAVGPNLSGAGAMGLESLLRNVLTPNAQLESGYYRHDITLKDGGLVSGFLASETPKLIVLRQIGADERAIPVDQVKEHTISKRSLMPEGLIDGFGEKQVADLFAFLMTLK